MDYSLINRLARPELLTMTPYQSARRIGGNGDVWLNANESPFTNSEPAYNRYPEFQPQALIERYAQYSQLDTSQILASRGADEAIELLIRTFCVPGKDCITICTPTYGMYAISAATCNIAVNEVPLTNSWQLDIDLATKLNGSSLLFICNPNNPTGSTIAVEAIEQIIQQCNEQCIVVIDEAYIEFSPQLTSAKLVNQYSNVVILRTLSKAFGLAGLRCGFMLSNEHIINLAKKVIAPYPIPAPVGEIAQNALSQAGIEIMKTQVTQINTLANSFKEAITPLAGIEQVYSSDGNFVLVRFDNDQWFNALANKGIVVRNQSQVPSLDRCLRFSIGSDKEMNRLILALTNIAEQLASQV